MAKPLTMRQVVSISHNNTIPHRIAYEEMYVQQCWNIISYCEVWKYKDHLFQKVTGGWIEKTTNDDTTLTMSKR